MMKDSCLLLKYSSCGTDQLINVTSDNRCQVYLCKYSKTERDGPNGQNKHNWYPATATVERKRHGHHQDKSDKDNSDKKKHHPKRHHNRKTMKLVENKTKPKRK